MDSGVWNQQTVSTVSTWRRQILSRGTAHEVASTRYQKLGRIVTIPCVVLSAVLGSAGVTSLAENDDPESNSVNQTWVSIVSMIIAALTAINASMNFDVRANQHGQASRSYLRLSRMIDVQMAREEHDRENASQFLDRLVFGMDNLRETSPVIDERILKHFPTLVDNFERDVSQQYPVINFVAQASRADSDRVRVDVSDIPQGGL